MSTLLKKGFKASKCKSLMNLTVSRIKLLRNKRAVLAKQTRRDVAQLLQAGQESSARSRVELVIREENILAAYDLIEKYCELLVSRLATIDSQKFCPADLKEAVSSLIFAAPRCADLQELLQIRDIFTAKYGKEFAVAAGELRPDCGVSRKIIEKLASRPPTGETKLKLMKEIAIEHKVDWHAEKAISEPLKPPEQLLDGPRHSVNASEVSAVQVPIVSTDPKMDAPAAESKNNVGMISSAQSPAPYVFAPSTPPSASSPSYIGGGDALPENEKFPPSRDTLLAQRKGEDSKAYFKAEYDGRSAQVSPADPYVRARKEGKMDYKNISVENAVVKDQDVRRDEGTSTAQVWSESSSKRGKPASVQSRKSPKAVFLPSTTSSSSSTSIRDGDTLPANSKSSSLGKYNSPPREELLTQQKGENFKLYFKPEYDGGSPQVGLSDPYTRARKEGKMDYKSIFDANTVVKDEDVPHDEITPAAQGWSESALKTKKPTSVQSRKRSEAVFVASISSSSIGDGDTLPAKAKFSPLGKFSSPETKGAESKTYFKTEDDGISPQDSPADPYTRARKEGKMDYKNISVAHLLTDEDVVFDEGNPAAQVWSESSSKKEKPTSVLSRKSSEADRNSKRGSKTEYKDAASAAQAAFESAALAAAAAQAVIDLSAKIQSKSFSNNKMSSSESEEDSSINQSPILKKVQGSVNIAARRVDSVNYVSSDLRNTSESLDEMGDVSVSVYRTAQSAMHSQSSSHFSGASHPAKRSSESDVEFAQTSSQDTRNNFGFHGKPLFDDYDGIEASNGRIDTLMGRNHMEKEENAKLSGNSFFSSRSKQPNMLSRKDKHSAFIEEGSDDVEGLSSGRKQRTRAKPTVGNDISVERFNDYDGNMVNIMGKEEKSSLSRNDLFSSKSKQPDMLSSQEKSSPYIEESSESAQLGLGRKSRASTKRTDISVKSFNDYDDTEANNGRIPSRGRTHLEIQENASSYGNKLFYSRPKPPGILYRQEKSSSFVEQDSDSAEEFDYGRTMKDSGKDLSVERVSNYDVSESNTGRITFLRGSTHVEKEGNARSSRNNLFSSTVKQPNMLSMQEKSIPLIEEDSDSAEELESGRKSRTERFNNNDGDKASNVRITSLRGRSRTEKEENANLSRNSLFSSRSRQEKPRPFIEEGSDSAEELGLGRKLRTRTKPIIGTDFSGESHTFESQSYLRKPQNDVYLDKKNEQKGFQTNHKTFLQTHNGRDDSSDDDWHANDATNEGLWGSASGLKFPADKESSYKSDVVDGHKLRWHSTASEGLDLSLQSQGVESQKYNDFLSVKSKIHNGDESRGFHRGRTVQEDTKEDLTEISWKDGDDSSYKLELKSHNGERQRPVRSVRTKQSRQLPSSSRFEAENGAEDDSTSKFKDPQRMGRSAEVSPLESTQQTSSNHIFERLSPELKMSQADSFITNPVSGHSALSNLSEYDDLSARFEALRRKR